MKKLTFLDLFNGGVTFTIPKKITKDENELFNNLKNKSWTLILVLKPPKTAIRRSKVIQFFKVMSLKIQHSTGNKYNLLMHENETVLLLVLMAKTSKKENIKIKELFTS